jgi:hypothetical protein
VGDCAVSTEKAGFAVGVQPVEDLKEQETYFHAQLARRGFIPVFIVMRNGSNGESFLFNKTEIAYGPADSNLLPTPNLSTGSAKFLLLGGGVLGMMAVRDASQVQENILKQELQSKTLSPGGSAHGFLYIPVPKNAPRQKIRLRVPITRADTGETFVLDLVF